MTSQVGGYAAGSYDSLAAMRERTPWVGFATMVGNLAGPVPPLRIGRRCR